MSVAAKRVLSEPRSKVRSRKASRAQMLRAIASAQTACHDSQRKSPDPVVESELHALAQVSNWVETMWPLPANLQDQIQIGAVAAKNIADWNPELATLLMKLDYALRHDGVPTASKVVPMRGRLAREAATA